MNHPVVLLGLLLLGAVSLRTIWPTMDPPFIGSSMGEYADSGNYLFQAREAAQTGRWRLDGSSTYYASPLHNFFCYTAFQFFGVGLIPSNLVSIISGIFTVLVVGLTLRSAASSKAAAWGMALLAFDFVFIMYNRINKQETLLSFFAILSFYGVSRCRVFPAAAGLAVLAAFAAFLTKLTGLWVLVAALYGLWAFGAFADSKGRRWTIVSLVVMGALIGGTGLILHRFDLFDSILSPYAPHSRTVTEILTDLTRLDANLFSSTLALRSPILIPAALLLMARGLGRRDADPIQRVLAAYILLACLAVGWYSYAPLRFRLPLLPLAAVSIGLWTDRTSGRTSNTRRWIGGTLVCLAFVWAVSWRYGPGFDTWAIRIGCIVLGGGGILTKRIGQRGVFLLLSLSLLFQLVQAGGALSKRTHELSAMYSEIGRIVGEESLNETDAYWAKQIALAADLPMKRLEEAPAWFVFEAETELEPFRASHPTIAGRLVETRRYPLHLLGRTIILFKMP